MPKTNYSKRRKATHYTHHDRVYKADKPVFSSIDRMPLEGEHTLAIKKALRMAQVEIHNAKQAAHLEVLRDRKAYRASMGKNNKPIEPEMDESFGDAEVQPTPVIADEVEINGAG